MSETHENLKTIRFEGEMLPKWAQLLDWAARLSPVSEETRGWFSRFTRSSGVDDARTVMIQGGILRTAIQEHRNAIIAELQRKPHDDQPLRVMAAWQYALDTMVQQASSRETCSWHVEGVEDAGEDNYGDGDITLRRV
jgi:hypothetical protein